ncbi:MAG: hypothetical protein GX829_00655 [Clostridium sp.]|nr:hypothetical protein [Clostridium sp.]
MKYNTQEELEAYFKQEIQEVSQNEIDKIEKEMDKIRTRIMAEMEETARQHAQIIIDQETKEMTTDYSVAISRLADESNRKLVKKRLDLTESLMNEVIDKLQVYSKTEDYKEMIINKVKVLSEKHAHDGILSVSPKDKEILDDLIESFEGHVTGKVDPEIKHGGFTLQFHQENIIIDETFDTIIKDQKERFYSNSNLIIE